jgi:hypothetical protein
LPSGFDLEMNIAPVAELTLMWSVASTSGISFELLTPAYVHLISYVPQLSVAENGVIRISLEIPCYTEKVNFD